MENSSSLLVGGFFMDYRIISFEECANIRVGEAVSLTAVMAVLAVAVVAVVVYRLFMSGKGSAAIPGGWKFSWAE